jgi:hypothetical protein
MCGLRFSVHTGFRFSVHTPNLIYDRHNAQVRKISHRELLGEKLKLLTKIKVPMTVTLQNTHKSTVIRVYQSANVANAATLADIDCCVGKATISFDDPAHTQTKVSNVSDRSP